MKYCALEFYRENIEKEEATFSDVLKEIERKFRSTIKMETIARKLETLHISHYLKDGINEKKALQELSKTIQELSLQAPVDCRNDRFRKRILHVTTRGSVGVL